MKHRCAGEVRRPYGRHFICRLWRRKPSQPGFARGKTGQPRFARVEAAAGPDGPGRQGFCPGSADASRTGSGLPPSGGMKHRCAGEVRRPYGRHFICRLWRRKPSQPGFARGKQADLASLEVMHSPFGGWRHHLSRWEACHWIRGSRGSPMNPVPLPPPQAGALWVLSHGAMSLQESIETYSAP